MHMCARQYPAEVWLVHRNKPQHQDFPIITLIQDSESKTEPTVISSCKHDLTLLFIICVAGKEF